MHARSGQMIFETLNILTKDELDTESNLLTMRSFFFCHAQHKAHAPDVCTAHRDARRLNHWADACDGAHTAYHHYSRVGRQRAAY